MSPFKAVPFKEATEYDYILLSDSVPVSYNEENMPLLGVPFTCKESIFVRNMSNTAGSVFRRHVLATSDAPCVANMRNAGAILLATTNTSEFCMWLESRNLNTGISRNPYNLSRIVGGSSGGEGGLLGAAGSLIGIGSDVAGSIRMPGSKKLFKTH
jgi:fatty acid amide hydrolase 2